MIRGYRSKPVKLFALKGDPSKRLVENADRVRLLLAVLDFDGEDAVDVDIADYH